MEYRHLTTADLDQLKHLYAQTEWSCNRSADDIAVIYENTDVVSGLFYEGRLVVTGRVLTDYITKAMIFDVIVENDLRRSGLGTVYMEALLSDPALRKVQDFELYTGKDRFAFYEQFGFKKPHEEFLRLRRY